MAATSAMTTARRSRLLFSPATWRSLIKPRLARLFAPFVERGLPVLMHSDGDIGQIVPDLVEIGLTALNPVQPEVIDHAWLHAEFDGRLAFYGGVSTQTVLPHGTPAEVREAAQTCVATLAPGGTGLILAPSHRLMTDVPMANVEALLDTMAGAGLTDGPVATRREALALAFAQMYGAHPTDWFRAPGRVDLMGSHTDYNDGYVATMTVDRDTWLAVRPRD